MLHLIRVGLIGQVGRFRAADGAVHPRGARVVVRTQRGLERGEVLSSGAAGSEHVDGLLIRRMTTEDELLESRLQRHKHEALAACEAAIAERGLSATLIDAELLLDGSSIYFYYLGEPTAELEALTASLAETYDARAQLRRFADTMEQGCGPLCGTEEGGGCGDGGCSSCSVASACKTSPDAGR